KNEELIKNLRSQKHDFSNHLQTIYGMVQLNKNGEAKDYIKSLSQDLAKIKFDQSQVSNSILETILIPKKKEAQEAGLNFDYEVEAGIESINLQINKVFRVISNLVDNAIDATKDFDEKCRIEVRGENRRNNYILTVYNSGPAIQEDLINKIFQPGFSTKGTGRGFGLHIIKSLVEEAGGELQINSEEGFGTEFVCYFPKDI
ncbi:MAG: sensor histidine kinase, partial [Bacillota bacterium]